MSKTVSYIPLVTYNSDTHRYISRLIGNEMSAISKPCYMPKLIRYQEDIKSLLKISDEELVKFKNKNISSEYGWFRVANDKYTLLVVAAIIYFCRTNRAEIGKLFFDFLSLKFYYNRLHLHFSKFCSPDLFNLALDKLSHRHLFKTKGGISSAVSFLSTEVFEKHKRVLMSETLTDEKLLAIIYELRHRIGQSLRSFAQVYYKLAEEKHKGPISTQEEPMEDKMSMISDKISSMICTYGNIDDVAYSQSIIKSGIRKESARVIIKEISNPDHQSKVKFIITLFNYLVPLKNICTDSNRLSLLRRIEKKELVANKYVVKDEIVEIVRSIPSSYSIRTIPDSQISIFLGHYLTIYLKNRIC